MNISPDGITLHLFGLYELDRAGTVLYARPYENGADNGTRLTVGQNIFEEMDLLGNGGFLKRSVKNFLESKRALDSFNFEFFYEAAPVKARVVITKGHERQEDAPAGIVIMDIKRHI